MSQERLQKIVARAGVASRRAAEELISKGRVRVNGVVVTTLGTKVDTRDDKVEVDGRRLVAEDPLYIVLHKPRGVVSTVHDPEGRPTVRELLKDISERVFPVGRLDYHTSGALLLTNDGEFCDGLIHPKRDVPKTYVLKVQGDMREDDRLKWEEGVVIDGEKTRPAEVFILRREQGKTWVEVTLYEGRNQQIRKMGEETGFPVMRLARTSFAGVTTERLRPGEFRSLSREELQALRERFGVPRDERRARPGAAHSSR
jgi:23S rRNA pseudouridine2605 synthase